MANLATIANAMKPMAADTKAPRLNDLRIWICP